MRRAAAHAVFCGAGLAAAAVAVWAFPASTARAAPRAQSASPSTPASTDQNLSGLEKRLAEVNAQIAALKARIDAEARKEATVLSNLARINLSRNLIRQEINALDLQLAKAGAELSSIETNMAGIGVEIDRNNAAIEEILATLYKFGRLNFLHFLLQARDIETYSAESKHLALLARYQEDIVAGYQRSLRDLQTARAAAEGKKRELAEIIRTTDLKKQELESESRKNAAAVAEIQKNRSAYEETIGELRDSAEQLQVMMQRIAGNEWVLPSAFVPLNERKGRLPWPLDGRIITPFGFQRHPQFNTIIMNNGVEIAPRKDKSIIQAVHAGKVVFADYFQGYGNLLIIDHGLSYFSLYGHCSEFLVRVGDMADQPVALVGDTGSLKGECLYFEIRHKTKALDPASWLKRR
jgi:septal ring factor EnvC (AmiA/AmiB activator)